MCLKSSFIIIKNDASLFNCSRDIFFALFIFLKFQLEQKYYNNSYPEPPWMTTMDDHLTSLTDVIPSIVILLGWTTIVEKATLVSWCAMLCSGLRFEIQNFSNFISVYKTLLIQTWFYISCCYIINSRKLVILYYEDTEFAPACYHCPRQSLSLYFSICLIKSSTRIIIQMWSTCKTSFSWLRWFNSLNAGLKEYFAN